jgi:hypothetical protein
LRWYDQNHNWLLTPAEEQFQRAERLADQLRALGVDPETL